MKITLETLRQISWFSAPFLILRTRSLRLLGCWNAKVRLRGRLSGRGLLLVGYTWPETLRRPSLCYVAKNGVLELNGAFRIFENSVVTVNDGATLRLADGYANAGLMLHVFESVSIGDGVFIAENVTIRDSDNHQIHDRPTMTKPIVVEDHVWIGMNVTILKGVTIGQGAVIAAGSVVVKDIAPGMLAAGVPAREIRQVSWS